MRDPGTRTEASAAMRSTVWNAVAGTLLLGCLSLVSLRDMTDNQSQKTNTFVSQDGIIALHLEGSESSDSVALFDTKSSQLTHSTPAHAVQFPYVLHVQPLYAMHSCSYNRCMLVHDELSECVF